MQLKVFSNPITYVWDGTEGGTLAAKGQRDRVQDAFFDQILILGH